MTRVLIVDDKADNRYLLRALLQGHGWQVDEASDGAEALVQARQAPPELVISDLLMPVVDGFTLLRHWKNEPALRAIPFIVYTATYTEPKDERLALDLGADAFIVKPAEPEPFMECIREVLERQSHEPQAATPIPMGDEVFLKEYNETLVRKLEKKAHQLEATNRELRAEIADRVRTEQALRTSEAQYRTLFHAISDPLFVYDRQTLEYLDVNDSAVAQYGYSREEFLRMTIKDVRPPADVPALVEMLARAGTNYECRGVWRHQKKSGEIMDVEIMAYGLEYHGRPACVVQARNVTERRRIEAEVARTTELLRAVAEGTPDAVFVKDRSGKYLLANTAAARYMGKPALEIIGRDDTSIFNAADAATIMINDRLAMETNSQQTVEELLQTALGPRTFQAVKVPYRDASGEVIGLIGVSRDVTEQRRLAEQLRQAQKMEAIGQLAGGVAHDFNNLLTVINGYCSLIKDQLDPYDPIAESLREIYKAGERAGTLTRQLLAFSRQQVLEPKVLNLNSVISDTEKMLRRLIGEDIVLSVKLSPNLGRIKADPGQVEQVLMNLAVNARDAMPQGGALTIETQGVRLDENYCRATQDLSPGEYVLLAVTDTGAGMDAATQARIFEPFFTTKGMGQGTGLGLAMVHGIVKQSRGHIAVYSELGIGTTFKVYLPLVSSPASTRPTMDGGWEMPPGNETLLLVEDEDAVRNLAAHILKACGYRVLEARHGREAIELAAHETRPIHLLISDVVMPYLGGQALVERFRVLRPDCRVLFLSGYADDAVIRHGVLEAEFAFLQKPFTPSALAQKVRHVLDTAPAHAVRVKPTELREPL